MKWCGTKLYHKTTMHNFPQQTSTDSPGFRRLETKRSYAEKRSVPKARKRDSLILFASDLSSLGSCWYTAKAPPASRRGITLSSLLIPRREQTNSAFSNHSSTHALPSNSGINWSSTPRWVASMDATVVVGAPSPLWAILAAIAWSR